MNDNTFLKNICFDRDDGVNLAMLNDTIRNQFYDKLFKNNVHNRRCVDIGFGTGFLSVLAIKHGAKHILAYEEDKSRYDLGCAVIKKLGLEKYITLKNQNFTSEKIASHDIDVWFHEIVDPNIWGEGLFECFSRKMSNYFLPSKYFLELYAIVIPKSFADEMIEINKVKKNSKKFSPGVDIDQKFTDCINFFLSQKQEPIFLDQTSLRQGVNYYHYIKNNIGSLLKNFTKDQCVAKYVIDFNVQSVATTIGSDVNILPIYWSSKQQLLQINTKDWRDQFVLLVPRTGMQHRKDILYLDTGHWGPAQEPILLIHPQGDLIVTHNLKNGSIKYSLDG